jgi:hypothetical protein
MKISCMCTFNLLEFYVRNMNCDLCVYDPQLTPLRSNFITPPPPSPPQVTKSVCGQTFYVTFSSLDIARKFWRHGQIPDDYGTVALYKFSHIHRDVRERNGSVKRPETFFSGWGGGVDCKWDTVVVRASTLENLLKLIYPAPATVTRIVMWFICSHFVYTKHVFFICNTC